MKVYNINEQDLNQFISLSENNDDFRETVNSLLGGELSFPEWCYVIERNGEIIERVGFWAPHDNDKKTIRIFGLELPWEESDLLSLGKTLLNKSIHDMKKQGAEKAAYNHLKSYKSIDNALNNMFLAYKNDEIIGLIIPQLLKDDLGAINYIGVIPAERGKGYVIDLLDKGIRNLLKRNVNKILADIDVLNFPMENDLKKLGFKQEKKLINYRLSL
mgnify:CR=1 FL=1